MKRSRQGDREAMLTLEDIRERLRDPVEDRKDGSLWAFCPCHDDGAKRKRRSLHISEKNGKLLFYCFAGCSFSDIAKALSLDGSERERREGPTAIYQYTDEKGTLLYEVLRFEDGKGGKTFKQRQPDRKGGHVWNTKGVPRVPYRLPGVLRAIKDGVRVFVAEGEGCVDRLRAEGFAATCNDGGAGKWRKDHSKYLKGANVAILPDHDKPGRDHAEAVARSLQGIAASIRIVDLAGLPDKGDIVDWFGAGNTKADLFRLVDTAPEWKPSEAGTGSIKKHSFVLLKGSAILAEEEEEITYLWEGRLPQGGMSLAVAKPKVGKTTAAINLSVQAARGEPFLGCNTVPVPVVYLALEEKRSEVRKRLQALGVTDEPLYFHFGLAPQNAISEIDSLLSETGAGLLVIDTLQKLARIRDLNDYAQVTTALEPLLAIARSRNCHILLTHHAGKSDRADGDEILGSTALLGAVDTAIILKKRDQGRTISTIQRYGENLPETVVTMEDNFSLSLRGSLAEAKRTEMWGAVEKVLTGQPGLTREQILEEVEGRRSDIISAIHWALRCDPPLLRREGQGKRNDPFRYFPFPRSHIYTGTGGTETKNEDNLLESIDKKPFPESKGVPEHGNGKQALRERETAGVEEGLFEDERNLREVSV